MYKRQGRILLDGTLDELKRRRPAQRRLTVAYGGGALPVVEGLTPLRDADGHAELLLDTDVYKSQYDSSHNCQWTLIGLAEGREWNTRLFQCQEAGFCMLAQWTIDRLKKNDEDVLAAVRGMIGVLEA